MNESCRTVAPLAADSTPARNAEPAASRRRGTSPRAPSGGGAAAAARATSAAAPAAAPAAASLPASDPPHESFVAAHNLRSSSCARLKRRVLLGYKWRGEVVACEAEVGHWLKLAGEDLDCATARRVHAAARGAAAARFRPGPDTAEQAAHGASELICNLVELRFLKNDAARRRQSTRASVRRSVAEGHVHATVLPTSGAQRAVQSRRLGAPTRRSSTSTTTSPARAAGRRRRRRAAGRCCGGGCQRPARVPVRRRTRSIPSFSAAGRTAGRPRSWSSPPRARRRRKDGSVARQRPAR